MKNIVVISHRRSGTHLTIDSLINNLSGYYNDFVTIDRLLEERNNSIEQFEKSIKKENLIVKTHAHADIDNYFGFKPDVNLLANELLSESLLIYVYRDGRDVLNSLYNYSKDNAPHRENDFSAFLRSEIYFDQNTVKKKMDKVDYWNYHVSSWLDYSGDNITYISFEDLTTNFEYTMTKLINDLGLKIPEKLVDINQSKGNVVKLIDRFKNKFTGKKLKYSSVQFNKGKSGGFKDLFSDKDLKYFDSKSHKLMKKLNYY